MGNPLQHHHHHHHHNLHQILPNLDKNLMKFEKEKKKYFCHLKLNVKLQSFLTQKNKKLETQFRPINPKNENLEIEKGIWDNNQIDT